MNGYITTADLTPEQKKSELRAKYRVACSDLMLRAAELSAEATRGEDASTGGAAVSFSVRAYALRQQIDTIEGLDAKIRAL